MKVSHVALALAGATAASAQLDDVPMCALDCLMGGLGESKCEETMDFKCQCGQADGLVGQVVPCVRESCDFDEQQSARKIAIDTCNSFGVSISLPPPESTGSAGPTATESSTSTSGSAAEPTETETGDDGGDDGEGSDDPTETEAGGAAPTGADGAASGIKGSVWGGVVAGLLGAVVYL